MYTDILKKARKFEQLSWFHRTIQDHNFSHTFHSLEPVMQLEFLSIQELLSKVPQNLLTEEEKNSLICFQQFDLYLDNQCLSYTLKEKEKNIFLKLTSFKITNNNSIKKEVLAQYCNYYLQEKEDLKQEEIILLLQHTLQLLNDYHNTNYCFVFSKEQYHSLFSFSFFNPRQELIINKYSYLNFIEENTSKKNILFFQTYGLLHEFAHTREEAYLMRSLHMEEERYYQELEFIDENRDFYNRFHDNFKLEKDANVLARNYTPFFLKKILTKEEIANGIYYLDNNLPIYLESDFEDKFQVEYQKMKRKKNLKKTS